MIVIRYRVRFQVKKKIKLLLFTLWSNLRLVSFFCIINNTGIWWSEKLVSLVFLISYNLICFCLLALKKHVDLFLNIFIQMEIRFIIVSYYCILKLRKWKMYQTHRTTGIELTKSAPTALGHHAYNIIIIRHCFFHNQSL